MRIALAVALVADFVTLAVADEARTHAAVVRATAYNSVPEQTEGDPTTTAFGYRLVPGLRVIAVSPDMLDAGLVPGTDVRIEGLEGTWTVADRMNAQWKGSIDIYMGDDVAAALRWGRRTVRVEWDDSRGSGQ